MSKKVFIIGFNRTATKAIHELFKNSGYSSAHYSLANPETGEPVIIAQQMRLNYFNFKPLLWGMDQFQCYSDLFWHREDEWVDANKYYPMLYDAYPDSYFILNTRDMDSWLQSKENHKEGDYITRCQQYHKLNRIEQLAWFRSDRDEVEITMRRYFASKENSKFLEFHIENDSVTKLIDFLKPDFFLDENEWVHV
jgi:hypothetical protein